MEFHDCLRVKRWFEVISFQSLRYWYKLNIIVVSFQNFYNPEENIWNKVKRSKKIGQD